MGEPLLLLHGFTGSSDAWSHVAAHLSSRRRILAIDLPGHEALRPEGDPPARITVEACAEHVLRFLDELRIHRVVLLGYSMGGRVALRFALDHPDRVRALVLESVSPGIADPEERAARRVSDEALAEGIERDGLAAFVDAWMEKPIVASTSRLPPAVLARERAMRMRHRPEGLAASLRGMGQGAMAPMWEDLRKLRMPALLLAGERDVKYREIARKAAARMPDARVAIVPGAGHVAHVEQPSAFTEIVDHFLIGLQGDSQVERQIEDL
jgi:2-succinyl-6-hydroxy-2,4-cyclohexadiene-1-carboxylate synthase